MKTPSCRNLCLAVALVALTLGRSAAASEAIPDSPSLQVFPTGVIIGEIAFDGANIWATDFYLSTVVKVRASDGVVLGRFPVYEPLRIASNGPDVWVANELGDLYKVRTSDGVVEAIIDLGSSPLGQVLFDGTNIWVAGGGINTNLFKIRPSDGAILGQYTVGESPYGLAFDGQNIWVTNTLDETVSKVRASDGRVLFTVPADPSPSGIVYAGNSIWVSNANSGMLTHLRLADGAVLGVAPVGASPRPLTFDGRSIWVGNLYPDASVMRLRARDGTRQVILPEGPSPVSLLFDGASVWVGNTSGELWKITPAP
jgi:DNA-binding beta-propeller fold protein YncE